MHIRSRIMAHSRDHESGRTRIIDFSWRKGLLLNIHIGQGPGAQIVTRAFFFAGLWAFVERASS
jgi:hypothetical protein